MSIANRLTDHSLAIFLFHGVVETSDYTIRNYTRKHLERPYFQECLADLRRVGYPLSIEEVVEYHRAGEPFPPYSFVITFDDGFANNYSLAAPILNEFGLPATFYVTTNFVESNLMPWMDQLELCLELTSAQQLRFWWEEQIHSLATPQDKIRLLDYLRYYVKREPAIDLDELTCTAFEQCGISPTRHGNGPLDLKMSWPQVRELAAADNFVVGGHTHRHAILSFLHQGELEAEIETSLALLRDKAGVHTCHYSYPEGLAHCYSEQVITTLKHQGIICCPTAIDGVNLITDDLFHLKRIMVI
jgi:peptidoglycan/xylan/chitin deacetylase (PgdA/CDA1 family)